MEGRQKDLNCPIFAQQPCVVCMTLISLIVVYIYCRIVKASLVLRAQFCQKIRVRHGYVVAGPSRQLPFTS